MPQSYASLTRYSSTGLCLRLQRRRLKMLEMRPARRRRTRDRFDMKEFHNTLLGNGILPIAFWKCVDDWIDTELSGLQSPPSWRSSMACPRPVL